jgi:predicted phosphodiesterase
MKIMVMSDTHLYGFNEKKYKYLYNTISRYDKVIINGDFWDGYITTFSSFISSRWSGLFPLMKKRKAVYVYGNHDKKIYSDGRVKKFCVEATNKYTIHVGGRSIVIEHGDRIAPAIDTRVLFAQRPPYGYIAEYIPLVGMKLIGWKFMQWQNDSVAKQLRLYAKKTPRHTMCLFGHAHIPEISESEHYANSGAIRWGLSSYIVLSGSSISLVNERYE